MKNKILFVVCLLFGLMFLNAGLNKFFNYMPVPEDMPEDSMEMFMTLVRISWLMPLIGAAEIVGGALFIFKKTRALGAVIICPVMAGIVLTNVTVAPEGLPIVIPLVAVLVWVIIENREKYLPMIRS